MTHNPSDPMKAAPLKAARLTVPALSALLLLGACSTPNRSGETGTAGTSAAGGSTGATSSGPSKPLTIGVSQEPPALGDPWFTNSLAVSSEIDSLLTAALTYRDNAGEQTADIATEVPTEANGGYKVERGADGKVIRNSLTYTIRPEAKWSDGTAITPADFQFWLDVYKRPLAR